MGIYCIACITNQKLCRYTRATLHLFATSYYRVCVFFLPLFILLNSFGLLTAFLPQCSLMSCLNGILFHSLPWHLNTAHDLYFAKQEQKIKEF